MDLKALRLIIPLTLFVAYKGVGCSSVQQKIYVQLNKTFPCVRLLNATHQIGCQSSVSGDTGVLHVLETETDLDWVLSSGPNPPYVVLMVAEHFNRSTMMKLKGSARVAGVAVVISKAGPAQGFSPHHSCPNQNSGVYSDSYGPELAGCNVTVWNPLGNSLSYEDFRFPIFSLHEGEEADVIRKCFLDHNRGVNGSDPAYPLCAMQLASHMYAVKDTATCMRRNDIQSRFSISPEFVCDALADYNVWSSLKPLNNSGKGHLDGESVVIAATRLDSRSFFWNEAPGGESAVGGFVTLLAAAQALRAVVEDHPPSQNILFTFFQGETFDYIGSSRMVYDMENGKFVIDLDNIHSLVEIGQVALHRNGQLWLHSDPVSRRNSSVRSEVEKLISNMKSTALNLSLSVAEPDVSQPLPPSSFQRFLRARPIPGVVLTDHMSAFSNRYYESLYDDAEYLNVSYPSGLSPEEQLEYVTDTAKTLAEVATLVARSLYKQAGGLDDHLSSINADPKIVTQMLYGFLVQSNNSWFRSLVSPDIVKNLGPQPPQYYVGVPTSGDPVKMPTWLVQYVLANFTGTLRNLTQTQCKNPEDLEGESKDLYSYFWVQGPVPPNSTQGEGYCVRAPVRLVKAHSPAFELHQYSSRDYSTWTESRWKQIQARIFLVASRDLEMLTLGVGVAVLLVSLVVTYFINSKADLLFSSSRETTSTAY
ncbi:nicastrin [Scleropages formosus]|uniref:Nicastrin n=2 Tax=Scleropages formosus TaxID=113540 RepID=A0A8C9RQ88_SCLFO|nr:nicastrin [Scleropages formosus]